MRPVRILDNDTTVRQGTDGVLYLTSPYPLGPYPDRLTDKLDYWADVAPDRVFLADRLTAFGRLADGPSDLRQGGSSDLPPPDAGPAAGWRTLTYRETRDRARSIAQALLARGLSPERPIVILSGNSVDHALLALAALYAGVYYAPIAPAYSLQDSGNFAALRHVFSTVRPGLVFADDGPAFAGAFDAVLTAGTELVSIVAPPGNRAWTPFEALVNTPPTGAVDDALRRVGADTIAKILFTSGSTGHPKGVINTQRMWCANQEQLRSVMLFFDEQPPVLCDWLPWNHTAGGNHNFGIALYNGGTLYIDDGKPTPALFEKTLRNLREIPCTNHFTVPRFYEMLLPHLQRDARLREVFFRRLNFIFYAAAGLGQRFWDQLREVAVRECGEELLIMTGMGATETAPFLLCTGPRGAFAGMIGLPVPGVELKLVPVGGKIEGRVRGPNITPGYLGEAELTRDAFDDEGFYCTGDAMRFANPDDVRQGLVFEGRLAEDFKLSSGTWVSVGPLRARIMAQGAGLIQDVVIAAPDRPYAAALIFPNVAVCREIAGLPHAPAADALAHPSVRARFSTIVAELAAQGTGSSTFVARAIVLDQPPSSEAREITDKGSINQKAVLRHRADLVEELYQGEPSDRVIVATSRARLQSGSNQRSARLQPGQEPM
ncbi:MAG TPA: feruloyl-CoA synthase [Vicinamibacterales bacterium]|nr:feruloyl-CoA synthase [Vicinamibacterales bacterium]